MIDKLAPFVALVIAVPPAFLIGTSVGFLRGSSWGYGKGIEHGTIYGRAEGRGYVEYTYFLKNKTTGEVIQLGPACILSEEDRLKHDLTPENWGLDWELNYEEVK
jgi:hypothetical protein